jgi:hypothetical protein
MIKQYNLGANDIASLLGVGFSDPSKIIKNKIDGSKEEHDTTTQELLDRGNRFEPVVRNLFQERHGINIQETGLKRHLEYKFITASPDGYFQNKQGLFGIGQFLTEFKVRTELSQKIPMKYWVQMQVQMAVWNMPHCVYCENVIAETETPPEQQAPIPIPAPSPAQTPTSIPAQTPTPTQTLTWNKKTYYWQLKEYREQVVPRDEAWWESVLPKICGYWNLVESGREQGSVSARSRKRKVEQMDQSAGEEVRKRRKFLEQQEQIIQPYMLSNYFRSDPLLDWLNLHGPPDRRDTEVNFFLTMIRNKNREFNHLVTNYITNRFPQSVYNVCPEPFKIASDQASYVELHKLGFTFEAVEQTNAAMERKVPIIFNPCFNVSLPSYPYPFGGRADMIVLNRYIGDLLDIVEVPEGPEDVYTIVNFKYATINLRADKIHLLNNPKQKVYKANLWLLNSALGVQQGYVSAQCYIIGRKYDFTKRGITYRINNAFQGVGTVDFEEGGIDESYDIECRKALEWLQLIRTPEAKCWNPFSPQDECSDGNMFPNMKNASDYPWHEYKREIAIAIKDITLMPHCGPKVRNYARERGVTEWQNLTPESIIYNRGKLLDRIMQFVNVNKESEQACCAFPERSIQRLTRKGYIRGRPCVEFYLDFEAIGNMYDDFSQFPNASSQAMIFLIGLIVVDNVTGKCNYVSYLIDKLDHDAERVMVDKMLKDMKAERERHEQDFAPVYFWSNAENYMLKRAMGPDVVQEHGLTMVDLCKAFRESGLILPGQLGYGLKDVAKNMYRYGMIQTTWDESADVTSGLNATIQAMKTYNYRDTETRRQYFRNIIDYNYVDCKVMEEILEYLRDEATRPAPGDIDQDS